MSSFKPRGSFAAVMLDATLRAESMQALCLATIHSKYEIDSPKDLYTMTLEDFVAEHDAAIANGTLDELNARLVSYIEPLIPQIIQSMSQPQGGQ